MSTCPNCGNQMDYIEAGGNQVAGCRWCGYSSNTNGAEYPYPAYSKPNIKHTHNPLDYLTLLGNIFLVVFLIAIIFDFKTGRVRSEFLCLIPFAFAIGAGTYFHWTKDH